MDIRTLDKVDTIRPLLDWDFSLMILAPLRNFADEDNIKAIDSIVFAWTLGKGF